MTEVLAAIDVGTNAVRLEIARSLPDHTLETLHTERDPVRPGEGVFLTGNIPRPVADRLLAALRRYAALCRRHRARVRAVATSAVREARNGPEIVKRAKREAGLDLEVVSGREEARLICLGVLQGAAPRARNLVVDIGGGSTEVAAAVGESPDSLWSVAVGAVRLTEMFAAADKVPPPRLDLMRAYAAEAFREALPESFPRFRTALGSSGTINALVAFAAERGARRASLREVGRAVDALAAMRVDQRRKLFEPRRAEIVVAGAVILESAMRHLGLASITSVDTGLRDGILVDLVRRTLPPRASQGQAALAAEAALAMGRRFQFDEAHALKVRDVALSLFDQLPAVHGLPAAARRILETAALLHDVGNAVSHQRHHKHTWYLVANADLPGLSDQERTLAALTARYHRRSAPERHRADLAPLSDDEFQAVRRLSTLLRVADALDRSHHQPLRSLSARGRTGAVKLTLKARAPLDLELWDLDRETALFRQVFRRKLAVEVAGRRR
ncbi:Ppx/GppA phosphatase family protein [Anaeromyxobacter paludicola]|uniref:Phosphatase n=1 Tax=Anaeromyxobacter paludicola TaxID=2918171 RepID=A0ABM7XDI8_9BACT|nr:Ppx/GppA phosphatase family protein [Anaeromyxobacter paludicola]BDG09945.1 phosphatase [Anaeromyxobacter paludicola]